MGGWLTDWWTLILQKSNHWSEDSKPHVRLPNLGVWQWEEEFLENQTLKTSGNWLQDFERTGGHRDSTLEGTHKLVCALGPRGRSRDPRGDWTRPTCWRVSCRGRGWLCFTVGTRTLAAEVLGSTPWREPPQSLLLAPPKSPGRLQCWVASGQTTNREGTQTHLSTVKWIKVLLGSDHHSNSQLYSPTVPPIKPLRQPHPPEGRQQKQGELQSCSLWNKNDIHRKTDKMKRQRAIYQMKEQDKTPEKQLNEVEIGNLPEKESD